mmetsp:Transcript_42002/g.61823  ORF Transcript_42002/g.61823 Transcript_42002/m.61823 type:complete len:114 (+) Transcript_42002:102-443(+)
MQPAMGWLDLVALSFLLLPLSALLSPPTQKGKELLVIYVGGTIGMKPDTSGSLAPASGYLTNAIETLPEFQDNAMPKVKVVEFDPILDSSCMGPKDWVKIAEVVEEQYYNYDG